MKIGFAFCGSFCNHPELLKLYEDIAREHEIVPILSENAAMRKRMQSLPCKQPHARRQIICGSAATRSFPLRTRTTPRRRSFITFSAAGPAVSRSISG